LTYDFNGNLTTAQDALGSATYSWDSRNRMTSITASGLNATFAYDALGRRTTKTINGSSTSFVYDGANPVQEKAGAGVTANILPGLGTDEYFTRTDSAGTRTVLPDALGSTLALTDSTGTLTTQYTYEPFGNTTPLGTSSTNSFQYTGRENDGTGLYYYRARYYSPVLSRFISEDPLQCERRSGKNLYVYAEDSPLRYTDPTGTSSCDQNFWDCIGRARQHSEMCRLNVVKAFTVCASSCFLTCIPSGPLYGQCIATCELICTDATLALAGYCTGTYAGEIALCALDYYNCQNNKKSKSEQ
jgi:RHS repeat-associated protein